MHRDSPGHARPPRPANAAPRPPSRPRHRQGHPAEFRRPAAGRARVALPRPAPSGAQRLADRAVADDRQGPPHEVLPPEAGRPPAARDGRVELATALSRDGPGAQARRGRRGGRHAASLVGKGQGALHADPPRRRFSSARCNRTSMPRSTTCSRTASIRRRRRGRPAHFRQLHMRGGEYARVVASRDARRVDPPVSRGCVARRARRRSRTAQAAGVHRGRRPRTCARHRRHDDDLQRHQERPPGSLSDVLARRPHGRRGDPRRGEQPARRPRRLPDRGVPRLRVAADLVRRDHRRRR